MAFQVVESQSPYTHYLHDSLWGGLCKQSAKYEDALTRSLAQNS